jgi:hypothetical protein
MWIHEGGDLHVRKAICVLENVLCISWEAVPLSVLLPRVLKSGFEKAYEKSLTSWKVI